MVGSRRVIFGVSSVGLGHVKRSLSVARELVKLRPNTSVEWVCAQPALTYLESTGERVLPESHAMNTLSQAFEEKSVGGRVDSLEAVRQAYSLAKHNYQVVSATLAHYDLLVQDEFLETLLAHRWEPRPHLPQRRAAITDFVDVGYSGLNPIRRLLAAYAGRMLRQSLLANDARIFADSLECAPRNLRGWVQTNFLVTGPITALGDGGSGEIRRRLLEASAKQRLICFTIGGTAVGKHILDFAWRNRSELSEKLDALLLFLTGPRVDPQAYSTDEAHVVAVGFTSRAEAYFQASDCVVTQAGASTLNELEALGKPTVCIPIEGHWEQERNAERFKVRDNYTVIRPTQLNTPTIIQAIKRAVEAPPPPLKSHVGAARLAAKSIASLLD
ncbi:MAG: glycosyltransferase [Thermoprotei archaeon]